MSDGIRTLEGRRVQSSLELSEPPPAGHEYVEVEAGSGERAFLAERVLRDAKSLTRVNLPNETGAVLMGRTFTDGARAFTIVTDLISPLPGEVIGTAATVEIKAGARRRMEIEGRLRDPLARAIGWMHSHPVQPAFFSATDIDEQRKWASMASVGLVVSGRHDADPRWRVFLGPTACEAVELRFPGDSVRRASSHPVPSSGRSLRGPAGVRAEADVHIEAVAPGGGSPEVKPPRVSPSSWTDTVAVGSSASPSLHSPDARRSPLTRSRTALTMAIGRRPRSESAARIRRGCRLARVEAAIALAMLIAAGLIIASLLDTGPAAPVRQVGTGAVSSRSATTPSPSTRRIGGEAP